MNIALRSGAKMPALGFGTFIGGKNAPDAYQVGLALSGFVAEKLSIAGFLLVNFNVIKLGNINRS